MDTLFAFFCMLVVLPVSLAGLLTLIMRVGDTPSGARWLPVVFGVVLLFVLSSFVSRL